MKTSSNENQINVISADAIKRAHRFSYEAMGTVFEIIILHKDEEYSRQAAFAAFDELVRIEQQLSRFIENSDVSLVNNLDTNKPLVLGPDAFDCIKLSLEISEKTCGAFDITTGSLYTLWLDDDKKLLAPSKDKLDFASEHTGCHLLKLDESEHTIELAASPVMIDLGGIGKGYALDMMGKLLKEWDIDRALLHGGFSSVLALDAPERRKGWPVTFSQPGNIQNTIARVDLANCALSASGTKKGAHIIDPVAGKPISDQTAVWVSCP
ncbi:MAG: FAD:protein FMN transferase, partial [Sedimentisphaerales bacterium]|nr:FAD:protein FMN transferase [Sedimentisphaerales bacterium]